jgi:quinol monooxygenase YgiN
MKLSSIDKELYTTYSEMKVSFRVSPPPLHWGFKAVMDSLNAMPGCVSYELSDHPEAPFHWSICGVWSSEEAKKRHYASKQLQTLLQLLLGTGVSVISCSDTDTQCSADADFRSDDRASPRRANGA